MIEKYSADAARYWAASARLGADTAFDEAPRKQHALAGGVASVLVADRVGLRLQVERGTGLGRKVLGAIEDEGRRRGCSHVQLDTFEFQALGFYQRRGYSEYGTLDGFAADATRHYLHKVIGAT